MKAEYLLVLSNAFLTSLVRLWKMEPELHLSLPLIHTHTHTGLCCWANIGFVEI